MFSFPGIGYHAKIITSGNIYLITRVVDIYYSGEKLYGGEDIKNKGNVYFFYSHQIEEPNAKEIQEYLK